jgi:hypothetical protein
MTLIRLAGLDFLGAARFGAKTPDYVVWISLDFLGFSRPNRDLSMGYAGFYAKNFSSRFFLDAGDFRTPEFASGARKGRDALIGPSLS